MSPFLKLDDFLAPLPLPAIIALLMVCGIAYLGIRLVRWLSIEIPLPIHFAAGFILSGFFDCRGRPSAGVPGVSLYLAAPLPGLAACRLGNIGFIAPQVGMAAQYLWPI